MAKGKKLNLLLLFIVIKSFENADIRVLGCNPEWGKPDYFYVSLRQKEYVGGKKKYRSFCEASIIGPTRLLTAANCFHTNQKRMKVSLSEIMAVAGATTDLEPTPVMQTYKSGQWRYVINVTSPRYYRYPLNDIALLHVNKVWSFDERVNPVPFASKMMDYSGNCLSSGYGEIVSLNTPSTLHVVEVTPISRKSCENLYMKNMYGFICSKISVNVIAQRDSGSGLVCRSTGDPQEVEGKGVLVGIQSKLNHRYPSIYTRVSNHYRWIMDNGAGLCRSKLLLMWTNLLMWLVLK